MADNLTPLVIKVRGSVPNGVADKWNDITTQMPTFTRDIITPPIEDKDGNGAAKIGQVVSGMPTIFARANMFKLALNYINDKNQEATGLMAFYSALVDEWRGFIGCLALDYANVKAERIYLAYSDGKDIGDTANIYEPKGAFGNMLFERKPLWCDQGLAANEQKIPFIDVVTYKDVVVGGTSPESFLFTSVAYQLKDRQPFIGIKSGKFTDPLKSDLTSEQVLQLYGFVCHIINSINTFASYYKDLGSHIQLETANLSNNLVLWKQEIEQYAQKNGPGYALDGAAAPPVNVFKKPFSTLFNFSNELYGEEGSISTEAMGENSVLFDPRKLLMDDQAKIARIDYGPSVTKKPDFINQCSIYLLKARVTGSDVEAYYYFALPLSPLGLKVFGKNLAGLLGIEDNTIASRLTAEFNPSLEANNLAVKLRLVTITGKELTLDKVYTVAAKPIRGHDILIWPNFISSKWNRYFMYSELPHNTPSQTCPFKAVPFVGDSTTPQFPIIMDEKEEPVCLAKNNHVSIPEQLKDRIKAHLHIGSDNRVSDNQYKYEIYESNMPFKGVKLTNADSESGYAVIRYSTLSNSTLPKNKLNDPINLKEATIGVDFGSTNTTVAYADNKNCQITHMQFKNRRVSLFADDNKDNNVRPAMEDEIFFFQNDEVKGNEIKSVLTLHDSKRIVEEDSSIPLTQRMCRAVVGGFPCFEKNLPIESVTENRYKLLYPRSGIAEMVYNMKWTKDEIDEANKQAYLASLLLHIYAQMFEDGYAPTKLKWAYPSAMTGSTLISYNRIWANLDKENPLVDGPQLVISRGRTSIGNIGINTSGFSGGSQPAGGGFGQPVGGGFGQPVGGGFGQPIGGGFGQPIGGGFGQPIGGGFGGGFSQPSGGQPSGFSGFSGGFVGQAMDNNSGFAKAVDIKTDFGPIKFEFENVNLENSMTEASAVANYIANSGINNQRGVITLTFDIGGSTTDISVLCQMKSPDGGYQHALIKQTSIRFAAQQVSKACKYSKNIKDVFLAMCANKQMHIQGLNTQPLKYTNEMAPYYFDQILDRLDDVDFPMFYNLIASKCPELMSINLYVTGAIMYYAGQLTCKAVQEIRKSEDRIPEMDGYPYGVNIVFAGKGSRIFDWYNSVDPQNAFGYLQNAFLGAMGGQQNALQYVSGWQLDPNHKSRVENVKYEVADGLAGMSRKLMIAKNSDAIELIGEEGFMVSTTGIPLPADSTLTAEMIEYIGEYFINQPMPGQSQCPRFEAFVQFFHQYVSFLGLPIPWQTFQMGLSNMNICSYVNTLPEFNEAKTVKNSSKGDAKFDFIAPIIILEAMKFYDDCLIPAVKSL